MIHELNEHEAAEQIFKPHVRGLAGTLGYLKEAWLAGDQKRVEWIAKGYPTCGDTFRHFQREWRYEVDRVLRQIVRDQLPSTRPWLPERYAERVLDLAAKMRPYKCDPGLDERCMMTWDQLGLDDDLAAVRALLLAEANAVTIKPPVRAAEVVPKSPRKRTDDKRAAAAKRQINELSRKNPNATLNDFEKWTGVPRSTISGWDEWDRHNKKKQALAPKRPKTIHMHADGQGGVPYDDREIVDELIESESEHWTQHPDS